MKIILLGIVALQALPLHAVATATGKTSVTNSREDAHRLNIPHFNQPAAVSEPAATQMLQASESSDDKDDGDENDDDVKQSDDDDSQTSSDVDDKQSDDKDSHDSQKSKDPPQYATVSSESRMKATKQDLAENLRAQSELQQTLKHLGDKVESDQEIEALGQLVANETESVATANMLERMWKEMRMFEYPSYENHVKKKLLELRREEQSLEAQMTDLMSEKAEKEVKRRNALPHEQLASNVNKVADEAVEHGEAADNVVENEHDEAVDKVTDGGAVGNDSSSSVLNFWEMTRKQQLNVMEFSLVYLVAGIAIAFLYKKLLASTYEDHFLPQAPIAKGSTSDFSSSILGCFAEPKLCILGFCCPCLVWANNLARTNLLSYWKAFMAFFVLMLLHAYTMGLSSLGVCVLGVYYRSQLRQHYGLGTRDGRALELAKDVFHWLCCQPCAIIQEAREEKIVYNDAP